jgi:hypothetical protein
MSYSLVLDCGCTVYVSHDPLTNAQRSRVLERLGPTCAVSEHKVGARVFRQDLLIDPARGAGSKSSDERSADY